ncbi:hypothetical protein AYI69_g7607 [Smittium culicis]|uniref:COP9 signalosome complex subunit 4 n=1 Tax=Smittium culicis TaxID=133412 RepID=A0A1R1XQT2_9FUNG|nr:hypothetical protein AYI69_g7607 [Smittium culicis]
MQVYTNACLSHLNINDLDAAKALLGRAGKFLKECSNNTDLIGKYKLCQARIFEHSCEFNKSCLLYADIYFDPSFDHTSIFTAPSTETSAINQTRSDLLVSGITCAILAYPDNQRETYLKKFLLDKHILDSTSQSLLQVAEKMCKNQIVVLKDNSSFSADTQLVNTILKHVPLPNSPASHTDPISNINALFAAHNIYCLSFIYNVIQFDLISDILGLDLDFVETSPKNATRFVTQALVT